MARGDNFPPETWAGLFERVASGETLKEARNAMELQGMLVPSEKTLIVTVLDNEDLRRRYREAREYRAHALLEEAIDEARARDRDLHDGGDGEKPNPTAVARSKLIVDTAFRNAEKMLPKEYGSKTALVTEDEEGNVQPLAAIVPPKLRPKVSDADDEDADG